MTRLVGYYMSDELLATITFLTWQQRGRSPDLTIDAGISLRAGKGVPSVVLYEGDKQVAVGYWDITRYWKEKGLCLC
jgi:hypothetical protein